MGVQNNERKAAPSISCRSTVFFSQQHGAKVRHVITAFLLVLFVLVFSTCEYEEEGGTVKNREARVSSINTTGTIDVAGEVYSYDEDGLLSSVVKSDADGNTIITTYDYDKKSRVSKITEIASDGATAITTIEYDSSGNKIHTETKDLNNIIDNTVDYYYDDQNRLIKKEIKEPSGALRGSATFNYEEERSRGFGKERNQMIIFMQ